MNLSTTSFVVHSLLRNTTALDNQQVTFYLKVAKMAAVHLGITAWRKMHSTIANNNLHRG